MLPNQGQDSVCNITSATVSGQYIVLFKLLYDCSCLSSAFFFFFSQAAIIMGKHVISTNNFCLFVWYLRVCCDVNIYPSFSCLFFPVPSSLPPSWVSILGMHLFGCRFGSERDGDTLPDRKNFDSLLWAIVTVFQVSLSSLPPLPQCCLVVLQACLFLTACLQSPS